MPGEREPQRVLRLQTQLALVFAFLATAACSRQATPTAPPPIESSALTSAPATDAGDAAIANAGPSQVDPDGNDDPEDPGTGTVASGGHFEKVGTPPMALTRICDLTAFGNSLYAAHANQPLGTDGATVTKYTPDDDKKPFSVAFDWNRPGEPTKGGGAGQGFIRVHAINGRLFVPDADPPYNGLGLVEYGTEGYVFISDHAGKFAAARAPQHRPPGSPDLLSWDDGKAGAGVLPRAYHVIDVIKYRGAIYASTGSVPPTERAWRGASPGALHRASDDGSRWTYETDYPFPWQNGVWRLTFMVRFKDRLYAGIQDYDGRDPNDYVYFTPTGTAADAADGGTREAGAAPPALLRHEDGHPTRITESGAAGTLRWWVDPKTSRLYWLAWSRDVGVALRVTTDGDHWTRVALPDGAGRPTDVTRFRDALVVLTERGLYRLPDTPDGDVIPIARLDDKEKKSPFEISDFFCSAPLAVFHNALYAGGQRGGALYRLVE